MALRSPSGCFMIRMKYIVIPLSVLIPIFFLSDNLKAADSPVTEESGNESPATETFGENLTIEPPVSEGQTIDNPANLSPFESGVTEFNAENYEEALLLFEDAYKETTSDQQIISYLGLTHRELQNLPEAVRFFKEAIRLEPNAGDANFLLADVLYNIGDLEEALDVVETALIEGVRLAESNYLKGKILLKLKKGGEAVEAFNEAKSLDPALAQQADFQIALVYLDEKEFKKAEALFKGLITIDPTSNWALFSKDYLEAIERMQPPYRLNLSAGVQYDDNVLALPTDYVQFGGMQKKGDWKGVFSLFGEYTFLERGAWNTKASYSLNAIKHSQGSYKKDTGGEIFSQDTVNHTLAVMPSYNTERSVTGIMFSYSYFQLASELYMQTIGVNPSYTFLMNGNHLGQFSLRYRKQDQDLDFYQKKYGALPPEAEERSANNYAGGIGYIYTFSNNNSLINLKLEAELNDASGSDWDYNGIRASGAFLYPFANNRVKANAYMEFYKQAYSNKNSIYHMDRNDQTSTIQPSLTYVLTKSSDINLEYTYIHDDATIDVYNYIKNLYTVNLVLRW